MSIDYIRRYYGVPAKKGGRVEYTGGAEPQIGTICGADGAHLTIRLDGMKHTMPYHPTWKLRYLDSAAASQQHSAQGGMRMAKVRNQGREAATGQFAFQGDWGRKCVCGHELGVHSGEAPHDCFNVDRHNMMGAVNLPGWFDQTIQATPCDCQKFRPTRRRQCIPQGSGVQSDVS